MIDIQSQQDNREVPLKKVGIKGMHYPIQVLDKVHKIQKTSCVVDLFVNLPQHFKGTHMSRFVEIFHKYHTDLTMPRFLALLEEIRVKLEAEEAFGTITFPFFLEKQAPVSGQAGMMSYECSYEGHVSCRNKSHFFVTISVPVTTLCPCSKAISSFGAHNQRGKVNVKVESNGFFWIEDIIALVEESASCSLYSVLKREDEKFVTEKAYNNPRFVEDVVREVCVALQHYSRGDKGFTWFSVEAENFESIHNHNAYAYTEFSKEGELTGNPIKDASC